MAIRAIAEQGMIFEQQVCNQTINVPVGPGLQIFGLMTLPFVISYAFWGELKSLRGQSFGEDSAGLQLVDKLATPLSRVFFWTLDRRRFVQRMNFGGVWPTNVAPLTIV